MTRFIFILLFLAFGDSGTASANGNPIKIPFAVMEVSSITPSEGSAGTAEVTLNSLGKELQLKLQCQGGRTSLEVSSQNTTQHLTVGDFYAQGCFSYIRLLVDAGIQKASVVELRYYGPDTFPGLLINHYAFIPSGADSPFVLK